MTRDRDTAIAGWLRKEVVPVYDAMKADPKRAIPADEVFAAVRARHAAHLKGIKRSV